MHGGNRLELRPFKKFTNSLGLGRQGQTGQQFQRCRRYTFLAGPVGVLSPQDVYGCAETYRHFAFLVAVFFKIIFSKWINRPLWQKGKMTLNEVPWERKPARSLPFFTSCFLYLCPPPRPHSDTHTHTHTNMMFPSVRDWAMCIVQ